MRSRRRSAFGFTLVELLVVIGIIALLAALLLPVLASATQSAKSARCKSRLGQIYKGIRIYLTNSDSYFPLAWHESTQTGDKMMNLLFFRFAIYEHCVSSFFHVIEDDTGGTESYQNTKEWKFQSTREFFADPAKGWTTEYFVPILIFRAEGWATNNPDWGTKSDKYDKHSQYTELVRSVSSTQRPLMTGASASYPLGADAPIPGDEEPDGLGDELKDGWCTTDYAGAGDDPVFIGASWSLRDRTDIDDHHIDFRHNGHANLMYLDSHVVSIRNDNQELLTRIHNRWNYIQPPADEGN